MRNFCIEPYLPLSDDYTLGFYIDKLKQRYKTSTKRMVVEITDCATHKTESLFYKEAKALYGTSQVKVDDYAEFKEQGTIRVQIYHNIPAERMKEIIEQRELRPKLR